MHPKAIWARKYYRKNREAQKAYYKKYRQKSSYKEKRRVSNRNWTIRLRRRVIDYLGGPYCVSCGCKDERILEINHINGGGTKEAKETGGKIPFLVSILKKERKAEFNILCRICNAAYYVKQKYGICFRIEPL